MSIYLSIYNISFCLYVFLSFFLYLFLSINVIYLSISSIYASIYPSVYRSVDLSINQPINLIYLSISSIYLSIYPVKINSTCTRCDCIVTQHFYSLGNCLSVTCPKGPAGCIVYTCCTPLVSLCIVYTLVF